jgi:hypothetical protein
VKEVTAAQVELVQRSHSEAAAVAELVAVVVPHQQAATVAQV